MNNENHTGKHRAPQIEWRHLDHTLCGGTYDTAVHEVDEMGTGICDEHDRRVRRFDKVDDPSQRVEFAWAFPVTDEAVVQKVLASPVAEAKPDGEYQHNDGRSGWTWLRLANGDLILGVWPQGDMYFEVEGAIENDYAEAQRTNLLSTLDESIENMGLPDGAR